MFPALSDVFQDPGVMEVMIDGYSRVYVEKGGTLIDVPSPYRDAAHLLEEIQDFAAQVGQPLDAAHPVLETRLPDASRITIVLPPVSVSAPSVTIRKYMKRVFTMDDLIRFGSLDENIVTFLEACVKGRLNIIVAGGTASGKTTVMNVIANMIPETERIVNIGLYMEIRLAQKYAVTLEPRRPDFEGRGGISAAHLVHVATTMRPDRIILTEANGAEALPMLQAMSNGYDGSMFSLHANGIHDALARLEVMASAGGTLPLASVREQIALSSAIITHQERGQDGNRRIMRISEITGMNGGVVTTRDLFQWHPTGTGENGKSIGEFRAIGV
jgi:pilus assembly protein CpaF